MHRVTFIGAGPGDPGLLTVAGLRALESSACVLAPLSFQRSFERELAGKEVESPFQMDHRTLVEWVDARLSRGNVSFLLPGDFSSFCPFQSFVAHYGSRGEVIPGISAHAAASAVLRRSFDLPGVSHATVLTSPRAYTGGGRGDFRDFARAGNTLVLYMNDLRLPRLVEELRAGYGAEVPIAIIEEVSCPGERVTVGTLETICDIVGDRDPFGVDSDQSEPSLALVVVGEALALDEDPSWWDRRYEKIWKPRGVR